jgi:cytochrome c
MRTIIIFPVLIYIAALVAASTPDARRGQDAFGKRCTGCHALDRIKVGPPLRRVYGRQAGQDSEFSYSDALKSTAVTWDEATLERWLTDTNSIVPENNMSFRLDDAAERADIIAYLKQLPAK